MDLPAISSVCILSSALATLAALRRSSWHSPAPRSALLSSPPPLSFPYSQNFFAVCALRSFYIVSLTSHTTFPNTLWCHMRSYSCFTCFVFDLTGYLPNATCCYCPGKVSIIAILHAQPLSCCDCMSHWPRETSQPLLRAPKSNAQKRCYERQQRY